MPSRLRPSATAVRTALRRTGLPGVLLLVAALTSAADAAASTGAPLSREAARDAARAELAGPEYRRSLRDRLLDALGDGWDRLSDAVASSAPGGWGGVLLVGLLLGVASLALLGRVGPLARGRGADRAPLDVDTATSAAQHREAASRAAADGRHDEALREHLRAVAAGLDERGLVLARPGRTASELAREAGAALPAVAAPLSGLALRFAEVWYGRSEAGPEDTAAAARVEAAVRAARADGADATARGQRADAAGGPGGAGAEAQDGRLVAGTR